MINHNRIVNLLNKVNDHPQLTTFSKIIWNEPLLLYNNISMLGKRSTKTNSQSGIVSAVTQFRPD